MPSLTDDRPNPGLFTAVLLYLPIGIWAYAAADADGVLDGGTVVLSIALGAIAMASAIAVLMLGRRFGYADA